MVFSCVLSCVKELYFVNYAVSHDLENMIEKYFSKLTAGIKRYIVIKVMTVNLQVR